MDAWAKIYLYEIEFEDRTVHQEDEDIPRERLVEKYGQARSITLRPQCDGFERISVPVPDGAVPVYFRRVRQGFNGAKSSLRFCIGWKLNDARLIRAVDSETGHVERLVE